MPARSQGEDERALELVAVLEQRDVEEMRLLLPQPRPHALPGVGQRAEHVQRQVLHVRMRVDVVLQVLDQAGARGHLLPPLELLPFAAAAPASAIVMFGLSLTARDGALMIIAFVASAGSAALILFNLPALFN